MGVRFVPCPGCSRHVKQGDCICPFCGAKTSCTQDPTVAVKGRMSRAALLAAGAVGAVLATTDCSSSDTGSPSPAADAGDASQGDGSVVALYGAFVPPDASDASSAMPPSDTGASSDVVGSADAVGSSDAAPSDGSQGDAGSVVAAYGAFVP
ncbi:MAG TPA: hypothetical protein VGY54_17205, partial [Polyangiaceae bacterium]|nr:hypothetical protein [Polyangiaceae bacterium]